MADDRPGRPAAAVIVGGREEAAEERRDAEDAEEVAADEQAARVPGLAGGVQVEDVVAPGEETLEGLLRIADLFELGDLVVQIGD